MDKSMVTCFFDSRCSSWCIVWQELADKMKAAGNVDRPTLDEFLDVDSQLSRLVEQAAAEVSEKDIETQVALYHHISGPTTGSPRFIGKSKNIGGIRRHRTWPNASLTCKLAKRNRVTSRNRPRSN